MILERLSADPEDEERSEATTSNAPDIRSQVSYDDLVDDWWAVTPPKIETPLDIGSGNESFSMRQAAESTPSPTSHPAVVRGHEIREPYEPLYRSAQN